MARMEAGVLANARTRPDALALRLDDRQLTYAELDHAARTLAHALHALGVRRGDRVCVLVPNSFEYFEALHACGRLGTVAVPINIHFKADEAGWIVSDSGATAVVVARDLLPALASVPDVPRLVVEDGWPDVDGELDPPEVIGDGWPTTMAYTSGTTGRPKGVAIGEDDFRRFAAGVAAGGERWGLNTEDVHLLVGPSYHAGPMYWAQMHLAFGGSVVIMARWDAEHALALIESERVTNSHMVPANFQRILALPPETRDEVRPVVAQAHRARGRAVSRPAQARVHGAASGEDKVWEYYGASEGGGTSISPQDWLAHPGSVGQPFPGNEFAILDDDGNRLPPGEVGTIWVKPAASSFEYHNDPEKTAANHRDGFFTVGDAGYLDPEGYLYLADRKSDMVITGGVNVYPREIEECLLQSPDIVDCAVLGVPDGEWGEVLYAIVQPTPGSNLDEAGVVEFVRERMADFKRPRIVELVDELPRDPNGKVRKPKLREAYLERQ